MCVCVSYGKALRNQPLALNLFCPRLLKQKFQDITWFYLAGVFLNFAINQLFISLLVYTCRATALTSHFRLLSVLCAHLAAPCCTGSHLSPRWNPADSWVERDLLSAKVKSLIKTLHTHLPKLCDGCSQNLDSSLETSSLPSIYEASSLQTLIYT